MEKCALRKGIRDFDDGLMTALLDLCAYTCGVHTGTYVYERMCMYVCARVI